MGFHHGKKWKRVFEQCQKGGLCKARLRCARSNAHQEKGIDANDGALEARVAGTETARILALGTALGKDIVAAARERKGCSGQRNA